MISSNLCMYIYIYIYVIFIYIYTYAHGINIIWLQSISLYKYCCTLYIKNYKYIYIYIICPLHSILYIYIYCGTCPTSNPDGDCTTFLGSRQLWSDNLFTGLNLWFRKLWRNPKKTAKRNGVLSHVQKHTRRQSRRTSQFDPLHIFAFHSLSPSAPSAQTRSKPLCGATNSPLGQNHCEHSWKLF